MNEMTSTRGEAARKRILDVAMNVFRQKGYAATRVEDICAAAGITKGGFFHHFGSKEELAEATARHWSVTTAAFFSAAPYHQPADPLDRLLAYVDFRKAILEGATAEFSCVAGTLVQEVHMTSDPILKAARDAIFDHAATLVPDIEAARARHAPDLELDAMSLALFTQASLQGAFIIAKAEGNPEAGRAMVDHLRRYIELLFGAPEGSGGQTS